MHELAAALECRPFASKSNWQRLVRSCCLALKSRKKTNLLSASRIGKNSRVEPNDCPVAGQCTRDLGHFSCSLPFSLVLLQSPHPLLLGANHGRNFLGAATSDTMVGAGFGELWPVHQWCLHARYKAWPQVSRLIH